MKTFIIDGNNLKNLDDFYDNIEKLFIDDKKMIFGKNLDALNDILLGGFGVTYGGEKFNLIWKNFDISKKLITHIEIIEEIINKNKHIKFIKA